MLRRTPLAVWAYNTHLAVRCACASTRNSAQYRPDTRRYANAREIVWCQEEPQNQGGWYQIRHRLQAKLSQKHELLYAGRAGAAAPATGISALHEQQQKNLVSAALQGVPPEETSRQTIRQPAQTRTGS